MTSSEKMEGGEGEEKEKKRRRSTEKKKEMVETGEEGREGEGKQEEQDAPKRGKLWRSLGRGSFSFCYWCITGLVSVLQQKDHREERKR